MGKQNEKPGIKVKKCALLNSLPKHGDNVTTFIVI